MKIISKISLLFLGMTAFFSCAESPSTDYVPVVPVDFLEVDTDTLSLRELICEDYLASYPEAMLYVDDELIVQDRRGSRFLFHKIGKDGLEEFVQLGNGPEDYLDTNLNPFIGENGEIGFYDPAKRKVSLLKNNGGIYKTHKRLMMNNIDGQVREAVGCGDFYLATGQQGDFLNYRFLIVDSIGNIVSKCGNYPYIEPSFFSNPTEDIKKMLYSASFLRVSPNKQKAVFASYNGALIQFFDLTFLPDSLKEVRSFQLARPIKHSQISATHAGWVYGFEDLYATNNYVYAIYNGQTANENPEFGHSILVFDWSGNLKETYFVDMGIRSLAVDESNNVLYLAGYDEGEMKLYVASMK